MSNADSDSSGDLNTTRTLQDGSTKEDLQSSDASSDESADEIASRASTSDALESDPSASDPNVGMMAELEFNKSRSKRYHQFYNDAYVALVNSDTLRGHTIGSGSTAEADDIFGDLETSQIGAVIWTGSEKTIFFQALSRYGRHDLPRIAEFVATKSQIEVKAYIDLLSEAFVDRQLFERETKNASQAEFPAAVEIGAELEAKLDASALALTTAQEVYDLAAGQQSSGGRWIITKETARLIDHETEEYYLDQSDGQEDIDAQPHVRTRPKVPELFNLTNWQELSEKIFMNWSADSGFDHWSDNAEPGQFPSLSMDAVTDFHHLVISLTQKVLQVAMFMSKMRIRASMTPTRKPAKIMSQADVHAALDVLNMKHDAWEYWARLPRRNKLKVYTDAHRKGRKPMVLLDITAAEKALLHMSASRSRSRSRSRGRSSSVDIPNSIDQESLAEGVVPTIPDPEEDEEHCMDTDDEEDATDESSSGNSDIEIVRPASRDQNRRKRRLLLEEAQDEYMDRLDRQNQLRHEESLWQLLGELAPVAVKEETPELGIRPKTLRKTRQELHDWTSTFDV